MTMIGGSRCPCGITALAVVLEPEMGECGQSLRAVRLRSCREQLSALEHFEGFSNKRHGRATPPLRYAHRGAKAPARDLQQSGFRSIRLEPGASLQSWNAAMLSRRSFMGALCSCGSLEFPFPSFC